MCALYSEFETNSLVRNSLKLESCYEYKSSPLVCEPEQEGDGRYSFAYCQQFSNRRTSSHPDDDIIFLENVYSTKKFATTPSYSPVKVEGQIGSKHKVVFDNTPTTAHLATSSLPLHSKVRNISKTSKRAVKDAFAHQDKPLIECKSEVDDDYPAPTPQLPSDCQPNRKVRKARKEMLRDASTFTDKERNEMPQDASTFMDKQPELEIAEAYFEEHPILDFVGSCCGMILLAVSLWYIFDWYVWFTELLINGH
ncbi:hypothetical protein V3C99_004116 [Haemonchus contortus]